jgi:hypothetical protein
MKTWKNLEDKCLLGVIYPEASMHGCKGLAISPQKMVEIGRMFQNMREVSVLWTA